MHETGAITGYIDVAQVTLYAFWVFFAGLIYYLHRENKREGYPLRTDKRGERKEGFPFVPAPKAFLTQHGPLYAPRQEPAEVLNARQTGKFFGAPFTPTGDPMLAGVGPGAWAQHRADFPDYTFDDNLPKIVPLRSVPEFFLAWEDPEVRGMTVWGADGVQAGVVADAWVDRSEVVIRYVELELLAALGGGRVLLPMNFLQIRRKAQRIVVSAIMGAQFAGVPRTQKPETVTFLEEEKIMAYYGGGLFYARRGRTEPLL